MAPKGPADFSIFHNVRDMGHWDIGTWDIWTWDIGTWDIGTWDMGTLDMGHWDMGHWDMGHWDMEHWDMGHWDIGTWDIGTLGTQSTQHLTTPFQGLDTARSNYFIICKKGPLGDLGGPIYI